MHRNYANSVDGIRQGVFAPVHLCRQPTSFLKRCSSCLAPVPCRLSVLLQQWLEPLACTQGQESGGDHIVVRHTTSSSLQQKHPSSTCCRRRADGKWQAHHHTGFDVAHVEIDWPAEQATCSQGHISSSWHRPATTASRRSSRSRSRPRTLRTAQAVPGRRTRLRSHLGPARCALRCTTKRSSRHGSGPRRKTSNGSRPAALGCRQPVRRRWRDGGASLPLWWPRKNARASLSSPPRRSMC